MRFLKKYWQEIADLAALELFVWSATRRYWGEAPAHRWGKIALDATIVISAVALAVLSWRLTKKWRSRTKERVRELSRKWMRRLSERVVHLLERWHRRRGNGGGDLLGGRTRVEYELYGDRARRGKHRRTAWRQLESERERIRWLYAGMVEGKLRHGSLIRPSETPAQIARRPDSTPEQCELIGMYEDCRYDPRRTPPEGTALRWKDNNK